MSIKLEEGKRYITRHGWITSPLKFTGGPKPPFQDAGGYCDWETDGLFRHGETNFRDLIAEYHEPAPAGWVLCKDRMPTEADSNLDLEVFTVSRNGNGFARAWDDLDEDDVAWLPIPKFTPPEKKKVPLGPNGVPPQSILSFKTWGQREDEETCWVAVLQVTAREGILVGKTTPEWVSWESLMEDFLISRDGGKTWEPCHKEVEV